MSSVKGFGFVGVHCYWRLKFCCVIHLSRHYQSPTNTQLDQCYRLLNVNSSCSDDELREAFLHLAKVYHPDTSNQNSDTKKFAEIENAYRRIAASVFLFLCIAYFITNLMMIAA
jgi:DnaJ domain